MATTFGDASATSPKQQYINSVSQPDGQLATDTGGQVVQHGAAPVSNPSSASSPSALSTARESYLSSLSASPELNAAKSKYLDFIQSSDSGIAGLEGQGRGIPLQIVRGEQAKLGKQSEITAKRLQGDVTLAEDNNKLTQEKAKAQLGFAQDDVTAARSDAEKLQTRQDSQVKFAKDNSITTPFYTSAGTTYRTSDNHPFGSEAEAIAAGVSPDFSNAPKIDEGNAATKFETVQIGTAKDPQHVRYGYDKNGNVVSATDLATGKSILGGAKPGIAPTITPKAPAPAPKPSLKTPPTEKINAAGSTLQSMAGSDGAVSPETWNEALRQWVAAGYLAATFNSKFGKFKKSELSGDGEYNTYPK